MNKYFGQIAAAALILCFLLPSFIAVTAQTESDTYEISFQITFTEDQFLFDSLGEYDTISLVDGGYLTEPGKPMLPLKSIMIALPEDMQATMIRVTNIKMKELPGTYHIFPAQYPQHLDEEINFIPPDQSIYSSVVSYPSSFVKLTDQTDLAGQGLAGVTIYPIHYVPSEKKLTLITSLECVIEGVGNYICGDYLPERISENGREMYESRVKEMVDNPKDVTLQFSDNPVQPIGVPPGDYDYVIITQSSWVDDFQPLADWKTKKGVAANIVTTTWIYNSGGYSGTDVQKIRSFVQDAHNTWGSMYFLLGGDTGFIPYHTKSLSGDSIPNDTYYGDYDNDYTVEVHIGRASVTSTSTISTFINKIFTYEQNPPSSYPKKIALFGFDLDSQTDGEDCKIDIDNSYIPSGWTVSTVYDSQGGSHKTNVISAVNAGYNLINHIDHCNEYYLGTGSYNHDLGLDTSDVDAFSNGNKQSALYSIGCWAAAYDFSNCLAEHFIRDSNGGGYAFIGNSRYGWYYQGNDDLLSLRYDRYFFRSLFSQNHYHLGDCFSDHKTDAYFSQTQDDTNKYIFTELTLLGDPELPIWKNDPTNFAVTHPSQLPQGSSSFSVHVETSGGSNVNNAVVCLWKDNDVFLTGSTNSQGDIAFYPSPSSSGTLYVTVTKQDYRPYQGSATVTGGGGNLPPDTPSINGPSSGLVDENLEISFETSDPDNDDVYYYIDWGDQTNTGWFGPYDSGEEITLLHNWDEQGEYDILAKAKDIHNDESSWSNPFTVEIEEDINLESTFLLGLISDVKVQGDYKTFKADALLYITLDKFDIKFFSSRDEITISDNFQGTISPGSPGFIIGLFDACV